MGCWYLCVLYSYFVSFGLWGLGMNKDCLVVGIVLGILLSCGFMLWWGKGGVCEVRVGYGNGNYKVVSYGVYKGEL